MRKSRQRWTLTVTVGLIAATWAAVAAGQDRRGARDNWADNLPPGPGKELTAERCGNCHTLERTARLRQPRDKWEATVYDMIGRGAPIFLDEAKDIIAYAGEALGPTAPPLTDVNQASKDDLMKLPGITAELAERLLAARSKGPLTSRDQVREVLGLDEKPFEAIRYYLFTAETTAAPSGSTPAR
jgi:hypothetical protein